MKICLLTYEYPRSMDDAVVSGEVKNSYYLVRGLVVAGHEVTVVSVPFLTRSPKSTTLRPGSDPTVYDVPDGRLRAIARHVLRIRNVEQFMASHLRDRRFDVIHAESPALAAGAIRARGRNEFLASTPIVTTAHGTSLPELRADRVKRTMRQSLRTASGRLALRLDRGAFGSSDAVIATSRYQRAEMLRLYRVPPNKVEVIHNGVDLDLYRPDGPSSEFAAASVAGPDPLVLFVGRLVPKKGLQHLIAAFPSILATVPTSRCLIVGGSKVFDTFGAALRQMAEGAGIADRFVWLQNVPEREMPGVYRMADVAVFPSVNYESLPTVTLEAMACGVPVVATDRWGTPEALGVDHPGLIPQGAPEELALRVIAFLSQPDLADGVRRDQLKRIRSFGLQESVARHEELYRRVVANR